ncbi:MAG: CDP-glycerol glycerophosphotransferase family protein, partial [Flavobacteriales bacterium]
KELPAYRKFRKSAPGSDQLLVSYLFGGTVIKDFRMFRAAYNELKKQLLSVNHSEKSEAAIANLLVQNQPSLYIYYARFRAFSKYFKQAEVKGVLMRDENSPQQKVIQYAARLNEVKTFGYQHGNIYQFNPAYIYGQYKTKPQLPDLTFVWGQSSFEMLLSKGGFAESEVCVTGRIDVTRQEARKNPKLDQDKKIILYATQPQHDTEMRVRHLEDVLLAAKELEQDYCLVIRPHPAEKDDAFFTQIAEKVGATNYFIDRFSDLNTHMQVCACLITGFSTVGTEFVPFFKPLLVMDYLNQDLMGWINQGVGEQILSRQQLVDALRTKTEVNKESHQKFIENHFFKMDGKAAQRISQAILGRTNAPI